MAREAADCQGILVRTAPITEKIMKAGKELKVISKHGVGVDNIDMKAANQLGIQVTNGPMSNASSVAEHAVALMAAAARHIPEMDKNCLLYTSRSSCPLFYQKYCSASC